MEEALKYRPWIYVTQYVIDHAVPRDARFCMLAVGIAYTIRGSRRIDVSRDTTKFQLGGFNYTFPTPLKAHQKIIQFDNSEKGRASTKPWKVRLQTPSVRPVENRPSAKRPAGYKMDGKYKGKKTCTPRTARRWHGLKLPFTNEQLKALEASGK